MLEHKKDTLVETMRPVGDAITWTVAGTLLGATGGALFGTLCGALTGLVHGEPWRILSAGAYFALCGATVGGLVGAYRGIFDRREAPPLKNGPAEGPAFRKLDTIATPVRVETRVPDRVAASEGEEYVVIRTAGVAAMFRGPKGRPDPEHAKCGRAEGGATRPSCPR